MDIEVEKLANEIEKKRQILYHLINNNYPQKKIFKQSQKIDELINVFYKIKYKK